jgi:uncharacterized protein YbaA (DUF1428 family)
VDRLQSRRHRDAIVAKVMKDPRMTGMESAMPFDGKRMIWRIQGLSASRRRAQHRPRCSI